MTNQCLSNWLDKRFFLVHTLKPTSFCNNNDIIIMCHIFDWKNPFYFRKCNVTVLPRYLSSELFTAPVELTIIRGCQPTLLPSVLSSSIWWITVVLWKWLVRHLPTTERFTSKKPHMTLSTPLITCHIIGAGNEWKIKKYTRMW